MALGKRMRRGAAASADVGLTSLMALRDSADAFPPLKSVAAPVLVLWQTAERVKSSKKEARHLSCRALEVLEALADAVSSHPSEIPPAILKTISAFEDTVRGIHQALEPLTIHRSFLTLNRNEHDLKMFSRRLDEAFQAFTVGCQTLTVASLVRVESDLQIIKSETMLARHGNRNHFTVLAVGLF